MEYKCLLVYQFYYTGVAHKKVYAMCVYIERFSKFKCMSLCSQCLYGVVARITHYYYYYYYYHRLHALAGTNVQHFIRFLFLAHCEMRIPSSHPLLLHSPHFFG